MAIGKQVSLIKARRPEVIGHFLAHARAGHDVPELVVRRRFARSVRNLCCTTGNWQTPGLYSTTRQSLTGDCVGEERNGPYSNEGRLCFPYQPVGPHMKKPLRDVLKLPLEKPAEIAFKVAVAKAIEEHTRLGLPVYVWRNGRVVKLSPSKVRNSTR